MTSHNYGGLHNGLEGDDDDDGDDNDDNDNDEAEGDNDEQGREKSRVRKIGKSKLCEVEETSKVKTHGIPDGHVRDGKCARHGHAPIHCLSGASPSLNRRNNGYGKNTPITQQTGLEDYTQKPNRLVLKATGLQTTDRHTKHECDSTFQKFVSETNSSANFDNSTGYDERKEENDRVYSSKRESAQDDEQNYYDENPLLRSLSVGKIDNCYVRGRLISGMENEGDYVDDSSSRNPSHGNQNNDADAVLVDEYNEQKNQHGLGAIIDTRSSKMENSGDDIGNDRFEGQASGFEEGKDNVGSGCADDGSVGGDMADGISDVTKMILTPISQIKTDNPGHVFYGNDDDNEDSNQDQSKYYVPLKTAIPPVRIQSLDEDVVKDASNENFAGSSALRENLITSGDGKQMEGLEDRGHDDAAMNTDTKHTGSDVDNNSDNQLVRSKFDDFSHEDPMCNVDQSSENFNENSKQNPTKTDIQASGDESEIPSCSSTVRVPFSEALSYRRKMECPAAGEQEDGSEEATGEGRCTLEGQGKADDSILAEVGTDPSCENEKSLSCALRTTVSSAGVGYSEDVNDDSRMADEQGDLQHLEDGGAYEGIHQNVHELADSKEASQDQTQTTVAAEVSVHATQNVPKQGEHSNTPKTSTPVRNSSLTAGTSSLMSGFQNFSLTGVLPFSDQKRLASHEYTNAVIDRAFEDFNLVHFDDEDEENNDNEGSPKRKTPKTRDCSNQESATIELEDSSDGLTVDVVDGRRRKSVAESAQVWLVDWTEQKGKIEWMPPLHVRRDLYRQKVLTQKTMKASGFVVLKNTKRKRVQQLQNWWDNVTYTLALWGKSIRRIEGVHGSGVASYFLFLRWLFGLNIVLFLLMVCFTTIPMAVLEEDSLEPSTDTTINTSYYCSEAYVVEKGSGVVAALEFIQGTGWMEKTYLFYGYYVHALQATYNLPLAYMLTVLACLVISLVLMARYTGKSFREALLNAANTNFEYSNKVFGAWDYGLTDENAAEQKQKGIYNDVQADMLEQSFMRKRIERLEQRCSRCRLYTLRLIINFFILVFLGAAAYLIYFVTSWSTEYAEDNKDATGTDAWLLLLVQYLPSLAITFCNILLPLVFEKVVVLEDYSQAFVIQITLIRTVFLRLASLIVLVISLYSEISCTPKDSCNANVGSDCTELKCWETYVGQQFYKLAIMDFLVVIIKVFLVELPRRFAASKCDCGLIKALGPPEFNIPANVLDLVYGQCLVWLGFLFCPLLPGLNITKLFLFFYVKKLSALVACPPTDRPYRASRINIFFMVILLVAFSLCALPVMYSIFAIEPSKGCGPFLLFNSMNSALENAVDTWPSALNITYDFLTSAAVTTIVIIFLAVAVYYLRSIGQAHKQQAALYREQLIMEGRDKQFLMSKLQEMYMPGQKGKQPDKDKGQKNKKKDKDDMAIVDERGGYRPSSNNPPPNPYSPPNAPVDNRGGDW